MTLPKKMLGSLALVAIVAGIWWVLSEKDLQEGRVPSSSEAVLPSALPMPKPPVEEAVKREATAVPAAVPDNAQRDVKEGPRTSTAAEIWEDRAQKMAALPNPDPALSSEVEYEINTSLAANLDLVRFVVTSVICRGYTCQILANDLSPPVSNGPPDMTKGWGLGIGNTLVQLKNAGVRNPRTGAQIKDFDVGNLGFRGGEIITIITFKEP